MYTPLAVRALAALAISPMLAVTSCRGVLHGWSASRHSAAPSAAAPSHPAPAPAVASLAATSSPPSARRVVLYGDSLAWEAQGPFQSALAAAGITQVATRTFGGTAMCDWLTQMRTDATRLHPDAVVIEFSGNALTPCMKDPAGIALTRQAYFAKYTADAQAVLTIFAAGNTLVYFAGSPMSLGAQQDHDPDADALNRIYAALAASSPRARYIDAGAAVTDHGQWTRTLPCLPHEPCTAVTDAPGQPVNVVRAPDGAHFCPVAPPAVRGVTTTCPVWSSGAYRYGTAMAHPIGPDLSTTNPTNQPSHP